MSKNILVIGAVALGPKAACRIKRLEPETNVVMIDQGEYISYGGCGIPYFISGEVEKMDELRQTTAHVTRDPAFFRDVKNVEVRNHTKALSIQRDKKTVTVKDMKTGEQYDLPYDKLVYATGSSPRIPPIPGIDLKNVSPVTSLEAAKAINDNCTGRKIKNAVIVGAGFIGLEMAVSLADMWGVNTTVIELLDHVLPAQVSPNIAQMAKKDLEGLGITVITGEKVVELKGKDGVVTEVVTDKRTIKADQVIFSIGVSPNSEIAAAAGLDCNPRGGVRVNKYLQTSDPDIYAGGDCIVVKNLISDKEIFLPLGSMANRQGRVVGSNLAGAKDVFEGVVGTWCVKLHTNGASGVGLTEFQAKQAGFDAQTVSIEQLDHAHFFPEKEMMSLEIVVDKKTRRVLGAQGFCKDGMSLKARIDAIAAMLQFKPHATLNDLANLEVSYSPPYASAMEIVNAAANVADNVLAGRHKAVSPAEFAALWKDRANNKYIFVDARPAKATEEMVAKYPGEWMSLPLETFEKRIGEIPTGRPIALICNSGLRAYECQLALTRAGIDSVNSSGGMQAMKKRGQEF